MKLYWQDRWYWILIRLLAVFFALILAYSLLHDGLFNALWTPVRPWIAVLAVAGGLFLVLPRHLTVRVVAIGLVLLVIASVVLEHSTESALVDLTAGRLMVKYKALGVTYKREVTDSEFTKNYRLLAGREPPEPIWLMDWETNGGWMAVHSDWFTHDIFASANSLGIVLRQKNAPPEVKRKVIEDYSRLLPPEKMDRRRFVDLKSAYADALKLFLLGYGNAPDVSIDDVPDPDEFARKWLEERESARLPDAQRDEGNKGGAER